MEVRERGGEGERFNVREREEGERMKGRTGLYL